MPISKLICLSTSRALKVFHNCVSYVAENDPLYPIKQCCKGMDLFDGFGTKNWENMVTLVADKKVSTFKYNTLF